MGPKHSTTTANHGARHRHAGSNAIIPVRRMLLSHPSARDVPGARVTTHCLKCAAQQLFMLPKLQPGSLQVRLAGHAVCQATCGTVHVQPYSLTEACTFIELQERQHILQ